MPRDEQAQMDAITSELIKDQGAADQLQDALNSIPRGQTFSMDLSKEKPPSAGLLITEREYNLIYNCRVYANNGPAGLPGHNTMILVAKLSEHLENMYGISPNDGPYVINQ